MLQLRGNRRRILGPEHQEHGTFGFGKYEEHMGLCLTGSRGVGVASGNLQEDVDPQSPPGTKLHFPNLLARERHQSKSLLWSQGGRRPPRCIEQVITGYLAWVGLPAPLGSTTLPVRKSCVAV